jgi:hypothetical protein
VRDNFVKRSFKNDFRIIFFVEKIGFKRNYIKRQGQGSGASDWRYGKMGCGDLLAVHLRKCMLGKMKT